MDKLFILINCLTLIMLIKHGLDSFSSENILCWHTLLKLKQIRNHARNLKALKISVKVKVWRKNF